MSGSAIENELAISCYQGKHVPETATKLSAVSLLTRLGPDLCQAPSSANSHLVKLSLKESFGGLVRQFG